MTTRDQRERARCPVDHILLDDHTNDQMIECDGIATARYGIAPDMAQVVSRGKIDRSWFYTLPERYQA